MVTIISLWWAILLSGVIVWIASAIVWMVMPYHQSDYKSLPDEDAARKALTPQNLEPSLYNIPHLSCREDIKKPEVIKLFEEGPIGFFTVLPKGVPAIGKNMALSFVFYLAVGLMVAYLASRTLPTDAPYLAVFRITGTVAWLAYGAATVPDAIWFGRPWSAIGKNLFDALIYGLLTAGIFAWLWPR